MWVSVWLCVALGPSAATQDLGDSGLWGAGYVSLLICVSLGSCLTAPTLLVSSRLVPPRHSHRVFFHQSGLQLLAQSLSIHRFCVIPDLQHVYPPSNRFVSCRVVRFLIVSCPWRRTVSIRYSFGLFMLRLFAVALRGKLFARSGSIAPNDGRSFGACSRRLVSFLSAAALCGTAPSSLISLCSVVNE